LHGGSSVEHIDAVDIGMAEKEGVHTMMESSLGLKQAQKFLVIIIYTSVSYKHVPYMIL
jgi:hypothetical protein